MRAWQSWSDAIRDYVPTNADQYGPFRVGPSYPLIFHEDPGPFPAAPYAHFGAEILHTAYAPDKPADVPAEIQLLDRMKTRWEEGIAALEEALVLAPQCNRPDGQRLLGLGRFIRNCVCTTIHTKQWWLLQQRLSCEADPDRMCAILDDMVRLGETEVANATATIPLVEADSRLGWEPSMEYMTDRAHLEWKLAQLRRVLNEEIPAYRRKLGR